MKRTLSKTGRTPKSASRTPASGRKSSKDETMRLERPAPTLTTPPMANTTTALNDAVPGLRQNAWNMAAGAGSDLAMGPLTLEQYNRLKASLPSAYIPEELLPENLKASKSHENVQDMCVEARQQGWFVETKQQVLPIEVSQEAGSIAAKEQAMPTKTPKDQEEHHAITTRRKARAADQAQQPQRPQSQYDERKVPTELDGIRRALGQHDWSEYVALVERLVSQEIDEKQFETSGRRIFYVIDARIRAKMEAMVLAWVRQVKEMEKDVA